MRRTAVVIAVVAFVGAIAGMPRAGALARPLQGVVTGTVGGTVAISGSTALVGAPAELSPGIVHVVIKKPSGWTNVGTLTASDGKAGDNFGAAIAISGSVAIIGAPYQDQWGAAYVFTKVAGGVWTQTAKLTAPGLGLNDLFGFSVGIAGTTAVVGAFGHNSEQGAVYVYKKTTSGWVQSAELTASDGVAADKFGKSVSLSGAVLVVGAPNRGFNTGAAYVFKHTTTGWMQTAELTPSDGGGSFGEHVAVYGTTAVIGSNHNYPVGAAYVFVNVTSGGSLAATLTSPEADTNNFGLWVAIFKTTVVVGGEDTSSSLAKEYLFTNTSGAWANSATIADPDGNSADGFGAGAAISGSTIAVAAPGHAGGGATYFFDAVTQSNELTASDGAVGDQFGSSVAASGTTAMVGSWKHNSNTGAVYVFTRTSSGWTQTARLTASDGAPGDAFGKSVAISGSIAIMGAYGRNTFTGAAYIFTKTASGWTQTAELSAPDGASVNDFGTAVAISGNNAIVGADEANSAAGAAYLFTKTSSGWVQSGEVTASDGGFGDQFGHAVAISGTTAFVGAYLGTAPSHDGAVYVFTKGVHGWTQTTKLTASDAAPGSEFGISVAVQGTTALVGAFDNFDPGSVYVFDKTTSGWTETAKLKPLDGTPGDYFGNSVSVSGTTAIIGAMAANANTGNDAGTAYLFTKTSNGWRQTAELAPSDPAQYDTFGYSVSISGTNAIVGSINHSDTGAAYMYAV